MAEGVSVAVKVLLDFLILFLSILYWFELYIIVYTITIILKDVYLYRKLFRVRLGDFGLEAAPTALSNRTSEQTLLPSCRCGGCRVRTVPEAHRSAPEVALRLHSHSLIVPDIPPTRPAYSFLLTWWTTCITCNMYD